MLGDMTQKMCQLTTMRGKVENSKVIISISIIRDYKVTKIVKRFISFLIINLRDIIQSILLLDIIPNMSLLF